MKAGRKQKDQQEPAFAGVQSEERILSGLPIRIDYQDLRYEYFCRPKEGDLLFDLPRREGEGRIRRSTNLDPYAIRDAFEAVKDPTAALRFLSEAGRFWPFEAILWSQFQEWQLFFRWLRLAPEKAMLSPEGQRAWLTADGFKNLFFTDIPRFSPEAIQEIGPEGMREIEVADRQRLIELRRFALKPERLHGYCISLEWHEVGDTSYKRCPPSKKFKGKDQKPFLSIEAHNIVEAIAATIYADRCDGLEYEQCKRCGKLFKVNSKHGQEFCPPTRLDIKTSPCKNAFLAQARRDRIRASKSLLQDNRKSR
jgi:hypothetical protein